MLIHRTGTLLLLIAIHISLLTVTGRGDDRSNADADVLPPERRPYQVRMLVAVDSQGFEPASSQNLLRDVELAARRSVGDLWDLKISQATWLNPIGPASLERLTESSLMENNPGQSADVWFVATIERLAASTRVSLRSWQPETQSITMVESIEVVDKREVATSLVRLCRELVRPMGVIEQVIDKSVRIRLRGGEISTPDPSFVQLKPSDVLLPQSAYRGKAGAVERLQSIPWTYITVDSIDGSTVQGTVQSGLKLALGGKKRGRIDTLVVAIRPQESSSRLQLLTQSKPQRPLVAHRIEVRSEPVIPRTKAGEPPVDPNSTLLSELLTDRRGLVKVTVGGDRPLVWLFAYSGQNLLARVPFIPGLTEQVALEVPDDATRLTAEADLQMLQSEVIDEVALRNTAIATIRAAARKNDWPTVNSKLDLIKRHQNVGQLKDRLTAVRVAGIAAAKSRRDKTSEVRINRMCDELNTLISAHLGDDKLAAIAEEMESLQHAEQHPDDRK